MSRDDLKQYQKRRQLMDAYKAELATGLEVADTVKASMADAPYVERRVVIRGTDVVRAQWLKGRITVLEKQCRRAEAFVSGVADEQMQALLHWHYIQGYSWPKVRKTLQMREVTTEAIRKRVQRFFEKAVDLSQVSHYHDN